MKVSSSIKKICKFCRVVKRFGNLYIFCSYKNRHKQRQG